MQGWDYVYFLTQPAPKRLRNSDGNMFIVLFKCPIQSDDELWVCTSASEEGVESDLIIDKVAIFDT